MFTLVFFKARVYSIATRFWCLAHIQLSRGFFSYEPLRVLETSSCGIEKKNLILKCDERDFNWKTIPIFQMFTVLMASHKPMIIPEIFNCLQLYSPMRLTISSHSLTVLALSTTQQNPVDWGVSGESLKMEPITRSDICSQATELCQLRMRHHCC